MGLNVTLPTALVMQALAIGHQHGFDVMEATALPSGTVYPILRRLEHEALVRGRWEPAAVAQREGRPPRRYYELTPAGERFLGEARSRLAQRVALLPELLARPARGER